MVNNTTSSCKNCMTLLQMLVLNNLKHNRRVFVKYVKSSDNILADSLSRNRLDIFWQHAPNHTKVKPDVIPQSLRNIQDIWIFWSIMSHSYQAVLWSNKFTETLMSWYLIIVGKQNKKTKQRPHSVPSTWMKSGSTNSTISLEKTWWHAEYVGKQVNSIRWLFDKWKKTVKYN